MVEGVYMTTKELNRLEILRKVHEKRLTQGKAAVQLGLSIRQVQRLCKSLIDEGVKGITSKRRGSPSNHQLPKSKVARVKELVTCESYDGFGPTLMNEKLSELHGIRVSIESTRQIMIEVGVWSAKNQKRPVIHQQRLRRARSGELVQIDGSPHAWFEDRGDPCDLLVFIDDATGRTFGRFVPSETCIGYMITLREYIKKYGRPLALYSDKHGIFRINRPGYTRKDNLTQFGRALKELEIDLICANSPQAKGRVERANQTLQDRLVKEMRLRGIDNIEDANVFLDSYWEMHNNKFVKQPQSNEDVHRKMPSEGDLERILCEKFERKISKNLEVQFQNTIYQLKQTERTNGLARATVTVYKKFDGEVVFERKGRLLLFKEYFKQETNGSEVSSKELNYHFKKPTGGKPGKYHPWKRKRSEVKELF